MLTVTHLNEFEEIKLQNSAALKLINKQLIKLLNKCFKKQQNIKYARCAHKISRN